MVWAPPQKPGDRDPAIVDAKKALRKFSYGRELGETDEYTPEFGVALRQFQVNIHALVMAHRRAGPDVNVVGVFDWATKKQLGLLGPLTPPAPVQAPGVFYSFTGSGGAWDNGFGFDVGVRIDSRKWYHQPLGYATSCFLVMGPDPMHSYLDMLWDGAVEFNRLALPDPRPKVLSGYSGGANVVANLLHQWPANRQHEIRAVINFGDPSRPPGPTLLGNNPPGHGISEDFPPEWVLDRYYSFSIDGDMYPNAVGLLPTLYDILVRLEATPEFAMYMFGLLINSATGGFTQIGSQLLGLGGIGGGLPFFGQLSSLMPLVTGGVGPVGGDKPVNLLAMVFNIPAIVQTLIASLQFLITGAHGHYGDQPVFGGMTGVDRAVQIVNAL